MGAPEAITWTKESTAGRLSQLLAVPVGETRTLGKCTTTESTVRNGGEGGWRREKTLGYRDPVQGHSRTHKTKPLWVSVLQKQKNRLESPRSMESHGRKNLFEQNYKEPTYRWCKDSDQISEMGDPSGFDI